MNVINNRTKDNHELNLVRHFKASDEAIIVSPFLSKSFNFFDFKKTKHLKKITLITTLKNDYFDQVCKINFFKNLFDFGVKESIEIKILIDNSLHGKIYIFKKQNEFNNAIITSANFTSNGLKLNNEWGIVIEDNIKIEEIVNDLISNIVLEPITKGILMNLETKFNLVSPPKPIISNSIDLLDLLKIKTNPLNVIEKADYWLKPIGSTGNFISLNKKFGNPNEQLHFALNPKSIKIGHILITYAVGYKKILSVYRVSSIVYNTGIVGDRWPHYVFGENLTRFYGNEWNNYNIHISEQKNIFIKKTKLNATPSGKNSYGTLQQGGDKLRITKEFGEYLINKIVEINKEIAFADDNI